MNPVRNKNLMSYTYLIKNKKTIVFAKILQVIYGNASISYF